MEHAVSLTGVRRARICYVPTAVGDDPAAIAQSYLHLIEQPRSAWSWEIEVRPWVERF